MPWGAVGDKDRQHVVRSFFPPQTRAKNIPTNFHILNGSMEHLVSFRNECVWVSAFRIVAWQGCHAQSVCDSVAAGDYFRIYSRQVRDLVVVSTLSVIRSMRADKRHFVFPPPHLSARDVEGSCIMNTVTAAVFVVYIFLIYLIFF
jgi:hypothetical protein